MNDALIRATMEYIENHPEQWHPDAWERQPCGTTRCFAGWAIVLAHPGIKSIYDLDFIVGSYSRTYHEGMIPGAYAANLLGLKGGQADKIFYYFEPNLEKFKQRVIEVTGIKDL